MIFKLKKLLGSTAANLNPANRRIFRSLALIVLFNIGGYFSVILVVALWNFQQNNLDFVQIWHLSQANGIFLNISAGSTGPILYMTRCPENIFLFLKIIFASFSILNRSKTSSLTKLHLIITKKIFLIGLEINDFLV